MQWALVGELGAAGAAAFLALACMAVIYLLKGIGNLLPSIPLGVATLDLGKIWLKITSPVVSWLVGATAELWSDAEWWFRNIAAGVSWLVDDIISCFDWDAQQLAHLFGTVIPQAGEHAISSVSGYVNQEIHTLRTDISDATTTIEHAATADAARALAKAEGFASTIKGDLVRIVSHDLTVSEKFATGVADKAYADAKGLIDALPAIPERLVAGIDYVTPAALAAVAAGVAAITTEYEECAVRTCSGQNNFSNLLQAALGITSFAAFAEFIGQAINDPTAAIAAFTGEASTLYHDADSLLDGLLSL